MEILNRKWKLDRTLVLSNIIFTVFKITILNELGLQTMNEYTICVSGLSKQEIVILFLKSIFSKF